MTLESITLTHFRSFVSQKINLASGFNLILGCNGVGKTSLLESIYLLAYSRSFRSSKYEYLIHSEQGSAVIHAVLSNQTMFGFEKSREGSIKRLLNREPVSASTFTQHFNPVVFIDSSSHRLFTNQSLSRRQLLDWGVYYTYSDFGSTWNTYQRILKQRNSSIKHCAPTKEILAWDEQLSLYGERVHQMRKEYIEDLKKAFNVVKKNMSLDELNVTLRYIRGWNENISLSDALIESGDQDRKYGYTHCGPHKGRVELEVDGVNSKYQLSEGQQKMMHYALRIAQCYYLREKKDKDVLILIDDLNAELDIENQKKILNELKMTNEQILVTSLINNFSDSNVNYNIIELIDKKNELVD